MKVLLALDGSASSLVARDLVASLSWPQDTVIHVVAAYTVPIDSTGGVGSTMDWVGDVEDAARDSLSEDIAEMSKPLVGAGLTVEARVVRGRAADAIIDMATDENVDIIVTGSRGRGPLRSMLLGSVASEVAAHAPCPVLVARGPTVKRMLVATDGSESAGRIPELMSRWGVFDGVATNVVAVAVADGPAYELFTTLYTLGDGRLAEQRREDQLRATLDADEMSRELTAAGIPATPNVRSGDPATEIVRLAEGTETDLVVAGSRGLGAIERILLGSVARNVLMHAHCSVLIVRSHAP